MFIMLGVATQATPPYGPPFTPPLPPPNIPPFTSTNLLKCNHYDGEKCVH